MTSGQIVIECNACYYLVQKSPKMDPRKVYDRLQREDRKHNRHKTKNYQIYYTILGPILESKKAPRVVKKLSKKKRSKHTEDGSQIMPKLGAK